MSNSVAERLDVLWERPDLENFTLGSRMNELKKHAGLLTRKLTGISDKDRLPQILLKRKGHCALNK